MNKLDQEREEAAKVIDRFVKENRTGSQIQNIIFISRPVMENYWKFKNL